jgi:hypothetical protein
MKRLKNEKYRKKLQNDMSLTSYKNVARAPTCPSVFATEKMKNNARMIKDVPPLADDAAKCCSPFLEMKFEREQRIQGRRMYSKEPGKRELVLSDRKCTCPPQVKEPFFFTKNNSEVSSLRFEVSYRHRK